MKNLFKNKRNILIMMFALVIIMGIGFAAYSQQLKINETSSIDSNWDVYIKSVDVKSKNGGSTGNGTVDGRVAASLTTDLKYPGDNVIYNITVANDGTIDALLEKINFSMEKENTVIKYYYSVDDEATWNEVTKASENPYDVDLLANTTDEFQVKVEYDPTKTGTATAEQKSNKLTLNLDYVQKTSGGTVVPSEPLAAEMLRGKVTTTGDGLYADVTESGRYIYRGTSPSNYITFNNETWRIMSVENDGTIKIIRNESIGNIAWDTTGTYGSNNWNRPATLNTYLNTTYLETINEESKYIIAHDFNIGTPGNKSDTEDIATDVAQEALITWNGKIGLMTITEVLKTTSNATCTSLKEAYSSSSTRYCNTNNWMWASGNAWTISLGEGNSYGVWRVLGSNGYATSNNANATNVGVSPVLYLISGITLSGEGTSDDPYTIVSE